MLFVPMTGKAEAGRKVLPDPTRPAIENGGFESVAGNPPAPTGWHYQRQLELIGDKDAPEGKNYSPSRTPRPDAAARHYRDSPSTVARWSSCEFQPRVRGNDIRPGSDAKQRAAIIVNFYDEHRALIQEAVFATWRGTFDWQPETRSISVPLKAREAIMYIGLLGAPAKSPSTTSN